MSKNKAQLQAEIKMLRESKVAEGWIAIGQSVVRWAAIVFIIRYAYMAVVALAGKETEADIGVNFLANINVAVALAWSAAIAGTVYGVRQNALRKDTVERLQQRIQGLEQQIDSKRTSSKLTQRGETRPEDKI